MGRAGGGRPPLRVALRKKKKARVVAVVRTVDERNGAVVSTSKPFTLKAPKVKKRRR